nr:MAG TPA: hypothetical protein [Caudoviricetes sp.]
MPQRERSTPKGGSSVNKETALNCGIFYHSV